MNSDKLNFSNYDSHEGMGAAFYLVGGLVMTMCLLVGAIIYAVCSLT